MPITPVGETSLTGGDPRFCGDRKLDVLPDTEAHLRCITARVKQRLAGPVIWCRGKADLHFQTIK